MINKAIKISDLYKEESTKMKTVTMNVVATTIGLSKITTAEEIIVIMNRSKIVTTDSPESKGDFMMTIKEVKIYYFIIKVSIHKYKFQDTMIVKSKNQKTLAVAVAIRFSKTAVRPPPLVTNPNLTMIT